MEGKKLNDYNWIYPIDGHKLWNQKFIYIGDFRNTYCPNCDCRFEFPEGIEKQNHGACPDCSTVFFFYPHSNCWYYLPDDFEFEIDTCPDCDKKDCLEKPDLDDFFYCLDCNIEFNWQLSPLENGLICTKFKYKEGKSLMNRQTMNAKYDEKPDPFGVLNNPADELRKSKILEAMNDWVMEKRGGEPFKRALDIGCGEGFITKDIPADEIVGFDISNVALSRCPDGIITVSDPALIEGEFDCILAAGVMVRDYDYVGLLNLINSKATEFVLTCQTDITEVSEILTIQGNQFTPDVFPYNLNNQRLRVFAIHDIEPADSDAEKTADENPLQPGSTVEVTGQDKTFKELIDEEIDVINEIIAEGGTKVDTLILSSEQLNQLVGPPDQIGGSLPGEYRGFTLEVNDYDDENVKSKYEFYHRPVDSDKSPEPASEGETVEAFPNNDQSDGVSDVDEADKERPGPSA